MMEVEVHIKDIITCFMVSDYCGVPGLNVQQCFQQQLPKKKRHRCSKCSWGAGWASPPAHTYTVQEKASNTGLRFEKPAKVTPAL